MLRPSARETWRWSLASKLAPSLRHNWPLLQPMRGNRTMIERRCPLCLTDGGACRVPGADARTYFFCEVCHLISADEVHHLSQAQERAHYQTHENSIENAGYVRFLNRAVDAMRPYLATGMKGLDYGCGPGPTLSIMLEQEGLHCENYDPLFVPRVLEPPYDFIFSTECFEHFREPDRDIERIRDLLRCGGYLGIMTEMWTSLEQFSSWYYTRDPTHVSFYHERTFEFVCRRYGFAPVTGDGRRVIVLKRL
jgi:Methyltransferase domain